MALDYLALAGADVIKADLDARVKQFAREAYQHSLNLDNATKVGNQELIDSSNVALASLDSAILATQDAIATVVATDAEVPTV